MGASLIGMNQLENGSPFGMSLLEKDAFPRLGLCHPTRAVAGQMDASCILVIIRALVGQLMPLKFQYSRVKRQCFAVNSSVSPNIVGNKIETLLIF